MTRKTITTGVLTAALSCTLAHFAAAQSSYEHLQRGFMSPSDSAKPRVWWHWMDGDITKEGIKLDLEWMRRVGLRGFPQIND